MDTCILAHSDLASNCGSSSTEVPLIFLTRAAAAVAGGLGSPLVYKYAEGHIVLAILLAIQAIALVSAPYVTEVWGLHVIYGTP